MFRQALSVFITVLGLNSLTSDLVSFVSFLETIGATYEQFRDYLFSFLPIETPNRLKDYLVIGAALSGSYVRADIDHPGPFGQSYGVFPRLMSHLIGFLLGILAWPLLVLASIQVLPMALRGESIGGGLVNERQPVAFFKNFALAVLIYLVVLFVFSDAQELLLS